MKKNTLLSIAICMPLLACTINIPGTEIVETDSFNETHSTHNVVIEEKEIVDKVSNYMSDDGYDPALGNPIDSVYITGGYPYREIFKIYKSGNGIASIEDGVTLELSEMFCKSALVDIDVLFVQKTVPLELSREYTGYTRSDLYCYRYVFEVYYKGKKHVEILSLIDWSNDGYDIVFSPRFDELIGRIFHVSRILRDASGIPPYE